MEWRKYYMDVMLVPLGIVMMGAYHVWLWHKSRKQPFTTIFGTLAYGRRFWILSMIKDIDKKNIVAVQALRNLIMGSTLMATTSILLCAGLGAVISSTYSVKKPMNDSILGAHGEFVVGLKYCILLVTFSFSFLYHSSSIVFLNQVNILICTTQDCDNYESMVTQEYLIGLFGKAMLLNTVGNRLFYLALSLLLWIFGPLLTFFSSIAVVLILYNLDFVDGNGNSNGQDSIQYDIRESIP